MQLKLCDFCPSTVFLFDSRTGRVGHCDHGAVPAHQLHGWDVAGAVSRLARIRQLFERRDYAPESGQSGENMVPVVELLRHVSQVGVNVIVNVFVLSGLVYDAIAITDHETRRL